MADHAAIPRVRSPFVRGLDKLRVDPSTSGRTYPYLDGIRGMAVLFIFTRHAWGLSNQPPLIVHIPGAGHYSLAPFVDMMSSGIDLFFVLSAFLLSQAFLRADFLGKPRPDLRRYYTARFLRIGPPYWVVLVLTLILFTPTLIDPSLVYSGHGLIAVILHALFLQTAWFGSFGIWNIASPFWTLTIEVMFYAILPWAVRLFVRSRAWRIGLPVSLLITVVWLILCRWSLGPIVAYALDHAGRTGAPAAAARYWLTQQIPASAFDFGMGMLAANLVVRKQLHITRGRLMPALISPGAGTVYALVGAALAIVGMWWLGVPAIAHQFYFGTSIATRTFDGYTYYFFNQLIFALAYGLLIGGVALGVPALRKLFGLSGLALFGVLGYSIYLVHMQLLYLFNTFPSIFYSSPGVHMAKLFFSAGTAVLICATGLYLAVERPFIIRSRRSAARSMAGREVPLMSEPDEEPPERSGTIPAPTTVPPEVASTVS